MSGKERGKSAASESPAHRPTLLIVSGNGQDYRVGARERIEQVAVRQRNQESIETKLNRRDGSG